LGTTKVPKIQHPSQKKKKNGFHKSMLQFSMDEKKINFQLCSSPILAQGNCRNKKIFNFQIHFFLAFFIWDVCGPQNFGDGIVN